MLSSTSTITLNDGNKVPRIGLGTWKSKPGEVEEAVKAAINLGYRHIDAAFVYGNEAEVGAGIKAKLQDGTVKREDLFICTKLWNNSHETDAVEPALQRSLDLLGLDYIDLYLVHWPTALKGGSETFPRNADGTLNFVDVNYKDTWRGMERCKASGKARSIGVSNFTIAQLNDIIANCSVIPAMHQVEINPYYVNEEMVSFCQGKNIQVTGYSPLGSADRMWRSDKEPVIMEDPKLIAIAQRVGKSVAQVLLRWVLQRNIIPIPKSVTPARIQQNFDLFNFELSDDDMALIAKFDRGVPLVVPMADTPDGKRIFRDAAAPYFPFADKVALLAQMQE